MTMSAGVLAGKRGDWSWESPTAAPIAYGIAKQARAHGAELMLTYQGDALKKRVEPLAAEPLAPIVAGPLRRHRETGSIDKVFAEGRASTGARSTSSCTQSPSPTKAN